MSYEAIESGGKTYWIDFTTVEHLLYTYHRASFQIRCSKTVTFSHPDYSKWNPLSWGLPDLTRVKTDYGAVRSKARIAAWNQLYDFQTLIDNGHMIAVIRKVRELPMKARQCNKTFHQMVDNAYRASLTASQRSVQQYMSAVETARFIRNLSADTILVGASLVSGGAAMSLAGAGSLAKGAATFQDTGKVGAALIKATGTFALAIIPIEVPGSSLDKPVYLILGAGAVDAGTAYAAGGDLREALAAGGAAMISKSPLVKDVFTKGIADDVPIPLHLLITQALADRTSEDLAHKGLARSLKVNGKTIWIAPKENKLIRQAPDVPQMLADLAILDTDPSVGLVRQVR